mmetsp:Transcript_1148/g.1942  ORF Transcript_1148/g.1942 Transcript_1148/m.1942 type:complete len:415 (-) Transcript_1148:269-1513(-)|eukprot:CAMPEP_0201672824 /NCGR_PEP_ID=MMETSP0494-20130426/33184_1 /ASSEMBLY_ACC=CAM_ASM_000839 /TAXON_ID=420259 /ORGANISM="Thalassiosira gravida, Strain GMp14c1" /LENGTH=414 /DNA_ID=CAMNT_0048154563 /DNA_START=171 /DNA_END=1415 /DNA_ORIENTATION=-
MRRVTLKVKDLLFTSATIDSNVQFDDGRSIFQTFNNLQRRDARLLALRELTLDVYIKDERYWTTCNRRLVAYLMFQALHRDEEIVADCVLRPHWPSKINPSITIEQGLSIEWRLGDPARHKSRVPGAQAEKLAQQSKHKNLPLFDGDYCALAMIQEIHTIPGASSRTRPARPGELLVSLSELELKDSDDLNCHSLDWSKHRLRSDSSSSPRCVSSRDLFDIEKNDTESVPVLDLRFTHDTIGPNAQFSDERSLYEAFDHLQRKALHPADFNEPLDVCYKDGIYWSMSNRRLVALLMFQALHRNETIYAECILRSTTWKKGKFKKACTTKNKGLGIEWRVPKSGEKEPRISGEPKHYNQPIFDAEYRSYSKIQELISSPDAVTYRAKGGESTFDLSTLKLRRDPSDSEAHEMYFA